MYQPRCLKHRNTLLVRALDTLSIQGVCSPCIIFLENAYANENAFYLNAARAFGIRFFVIAGAVCLEKFGCCISHGAATILST